MNNDDHPLRTTQVEIYPPPPPPYKEADEPNSVEIPKQGNTNANPYAQSSQQSNVERVSPQVQVVAVETASTNITSESPISCTCPKCQQRITTRVEKHNGLLVWLIVLLLILLGLWLGCCLIPFCIDDLKDTDHFCPNCGHLIGRRKKI